MLKWHQICIWCRSILCGSFMIACEHEHIGLQSRPWMYWAMILYKMFWTWTPSHLLISVLNSFSVVLYAIFVWLLFMYVCILMYCAVILYMKFWTWTPSHLLMSVLYSFYGFFVCSLFIYVCILCIFDVKSLNCWNCIFKKLLNLLVFIH